MDMLLKKQSLAIFIGALSLFSFSVYGDKGGNTNTGGGIAGLEVSTLSTSFSPIQVNYNGLGFLTDFGSDLGMVEVLLLDVNGFTVYTDWVDTSFNRQYYIDAFGLSSGAYTLYFTDVNGRIIHNTTMTVD